MLNIVLFGPYRPHGFISGNASPLLSLTPQNTFNMLAPALLIKSATHPSLADVRSYTKKLESPLNLMALIKNKYLLYIINEIKKNIYISFIHLYKQGNDYSR